MDQITNRSTIERDRDDAPSGRSASRRWITGATVILVLLVGYGGFSYYERGKGQAAAPQAAVLPVTVSQPLRQEIDTRLGFLGQFSAIDRVELRAQVGGTLTEIHFKDGQIVHKGDLLFVIDPRPYEIKLAQPAAAHSPCNCPLIGRAMVRRLSLHKIAMSPRRCDRRATSITRVRFFAGAPVVLAIMIPNMIERR